MIRLNTPKGYLRLKTFTADSIDYTVVYDSTRGGKVYRQSNSGNISTISSTNIVTLEIPGEQIEIVDITIVNSGTLNNIVQIFKVVNDVEFPIGSLDISLATQEYLQYTTENGLVRYNATGQIMTVGETGAQGPPGDRAGYNYAFSTTTTPGDPGSGVINFNNAVLASVTVIRVSYTDSLANDLSAYIQTFDDSTSPIKGVLNLQSSNNADSSFISFNVTSFTDQTTYGELTGTFVSGVAFADLESIVLNYSRTGDLASGDVPNSRTLTINGVDHDLSANREWVTGYADTGALVYGGLTVVSATQVDVGAVNGYIVDNETDPDNPTYTFVSYPGGTNITVPTIGSGTISYLLLDSTGSLVWQNTFPTSTERKQMIWLSKVGHPDSVSLTVAVDEVDYIISPMAFSRDMFQAINYINDGLYAYPSNPNLTWATTTGNIHGNGINFVNDNTNPNEISRVGTLTTPFLYRTQIGGATGLVTNIDPANYDNGGVITAVGGGANASTIQHIYAVPISTGINFIIQYGQTVYSTFTNAVAAVGKETFVVYEPLIDNAILIGVVVLNKNATDLTDSNNALFLMADKFGQIIGAQAGVSTTTLQKAYDNSVIPQILTSVLNGAVTFRNGRALDTDTVQEWQNIAGLTTASINGDGKIVSLGIELTGQTASRIAGFDASKNIISLDTATYPSLTELSYVKGVTSSIQSQINTKIDNTVTSLPSLVTVGALSGGSITTGFVVGGVTMTLGSDATGDIYYRNSGGVLTRLPIGTSNQLLTVTGGLPAWATVSTGLTIGSTAITSGTVNRVLYEGAGNLLQESADLMFDGTYMSVGLGSISTSNRLYVRGASASVGNSFLSENLTGTAYFKILNSGGVDQNHPTGGSNIDYHLWRNGGTQIAGIQATAGFIGLWFNNSSSKGIGYESNSIAIRGIFSNPAVPTSNSHAAVGFQATGTIIDQTNTIFYDFGYLGRTFNNLSGVDARILRIRESLIVSGTGSGVFKIIENKPTYTISGTNTTSFIGYNYDPTISGTIGGSHYGMLIRPATLNGIGLGSTMPTALLDLKAATGYNQLRLETSYTPTSSADTNGSVGDISWDANYLYWKTGGGWMRATGASF